MADNVDVTPGTGATIATDDVGGVHYQRVKVAFGANGSADDVSIGKGLPTRGDVLTASGALDDTGTLFTVDAAGYRSAFMRVVIPDVAEERTVYFRESVNGTDWTDSNSPFYNPILPQTPRYNVDPYPGPQDIYMPITGRYVRAYTAVTGGPIAQNIEIEAVFFEQPFTFPYLTPAPISYDEGESVQLMGGGLPVRYGVNYVPEQSTSTDDTDIFTNYACAGYASFTLEVSGDGDGELEVQFVYGDGDRFRVPVHDVAVSPSPAIFQITAPGVYVGAIVADFVSVHVSSLTTGTWTAQLRMSAAPFVAPQ